MINSGSDADFAKEAFLMFKVFYKHYCAFCGRPLRIGEQEIVVSEEFDLYHRECYSDQSAEN
jgi:hypothetical protein